MTPVQGGIWWADMDKRRPVLVVTRTDAVDVLTSIVVAPITRTIRGIPTEIDLGVEHGLSEDCVASFDSLQTVRRRSLTEHIGQLSADQAHEICRAMTAMTDC